MADDSVDFTEIDCLFVVVADNDWTFTWAWASIGAGYTQTDDGICNFSYIRMGSDLFSSGSYLIPHELGHALFGLYHEAGENIAKKDACGYEGAEPEEYNGFSVMGNKFLFLSLWTQYLLEWLSGERVTYFENSSDSGLVEFCPSEVENTDKKQLGIIRVGGYKYSVQLYEKGLESYLDSNSNVKSGLLIRRHENVVDNDGYGGYDSTVLLKEDDDYESYLHPGEEICGLGRDGNISIKYVSITGEGEDVIVKVEVIIEGAEPTPTPSPSPSPTPSPSPSPTPSPPPSPLPSPTPEIFPTPYPTPTEPATGDVEKINIFSTNIKEGKLLIRKGKEVEVSVEALAEGAFGDILMPNVVITAKVVGRRIKISPSDALTNDYGQATFTITAKKKIGNSKVTFKAGKVKRSVIIKVSK